MNVMVRRVREATVVDLTGNLIVGQPVDSLRAQIREQLASGATNLAINFADVNYVDSAGIGALVSAHTSALGAKGRCVLFGAQGRVISVLRTCRLDTALELAGDESSAVSSISELDVRRAA